MVCIKLPAVAFIRTVVAGITYSITITVKLIMICYRRAVIIT